MNWQEAIENLDTSAKNEGCPDLEAFENSLKLSTYIGWSAQFDDHMKMYWVRKWQCTDQLVGLAVYRFKGEVVAVSSQRYRKSDTEIQFLSVAAASKVRDFILYLVDVMTPDIVDLSDEIDPWFFEQADS